MRRNETEAMMAVVALSLAGCSEMGDSSFGSYETGTSDPSGTGTLDIEPGQMTAGDWDDNANFDLFLEYQGAARSALPGDPGIDVADRVVVTVLDGAGDPVPGATVTVLADGSPVASSTVGANGRFLFFPGHDGAGSASDIVVGAVPPASEDLAFRTATLAPGARSVDVVLDGAVATRPTALDVAFVIDTTGSMSDEITYINAEIQGIVDTVHAWQSGLDTRWAIVVYRDEGDVYVTRAFDFTSDVSDFTSHLSHQLAGGGGDYPEAMEQALGEMNRLSWRAGNVARVAFLIADAPPHPENAQAMLAQAGVARLGGIRIFPVAASGVADSAEYLMRTAALVTLGRYVFVTDDSGIGADHAEPHLPCYRVQYLADLMARMILSCLSGSVLPPHPDAVIRTVGDPVDGVCTLDDGSFAYL